MLILILKFQIEDDDDDEHESGRALTCTPAAVTLATSMLDTIEKRAAELDLRADKTRGTEHLAEVTAYVTALVMTYVTKGKFIQP